MKINYNPTQNRIYLVSYGTLNRTSFGQKAIEKHGFPPFIDSSCRREPDFESKYPSITALCRGVVFAPKLKVGDIAVYITKKMHGFNHLVAILQVIEKCSSHQIAASWYKNNNLPVPSNCLVKGNKPKKLDETGGNNCACSGDVKGIKEFLLLSSDQQIKIATKIITSWDSKYQQRANENSDFIITKPWYLELDQPIGISKDDFENIFNRVPVTRNPPKITFSQLQKLGKLANLTIV